MKKAILTLALLMAAGTATFAQCDRNLTLTASKRENLDAAGVLKNTEEEKILINISKTDIVIAHGDEGRKMTGSIKTNTCNWSEPFKNGKSVIKALLANENGDEKGATITIEGKNGTVTLLFELDDMPEEKIRITADKFEEKV